MTERNLAISYECVKIVEIDTNKSDEDLIEAIINTIATLEGVRPTELPPLHDSIEPMAFRLLMTHARQHVSSDFAICFSYVDWNILVRGDGTVIIGNPSERTAPTPLF